MRSCDKFTTRNDWFRVGVIRREHGKHKNFGRLFGKIFKPFTSFKYSQFYKKKIISQFDQQIFSLLVSNLERFDEKNKDEFDAIHNTLGKLAFI